MTNVMENKLKKNKWKTKQIMNKNKWNEKQLKKKKMERIN